MRVLHLHAGCCCRIDWITGRSRSTSFAPVLQRAHVLRQARPAEREARLQVVGREVQLRRPAEDVHHLVAVDAEPLADVADLVGEADLQRVPGVARVLHHLGDADARADERRVDLLRRARWSPLASAAWLWPTSVSGGWRKSRSARAFAQELRVHGDAEALAVLLARAPARAPGSRPRASCPAAPCCARRRRGSRACRAARSPICSRHALEVGEVEAAVLAARRADAEQRDVARRAPPPRCRSSPAAGRLAAPSANQLVEPRLDDRAAALVDAARPCPAFTSTPTTVVAVRGERRPPRRSRRIRDRTLRRS